MQRLSEDQRQRREAGHRGGDYLRRLWLRAIALRRGGASHPRSWVVGLPVVPQRRPPSGAYQYFTTPPGENIGA
jgi:hypothetical protein